MYKKNNANGRKSILFDSCQTHGRQLSNVRLTRVKQLFDSCQTTENFKQSNIIVSMWRRKF